MTSLALALGYALVLWWASTGLILFLDRLPTRTFRWSMGGATLVLALALYGLVQTRDDASAGGAYAAFTCGLLIWGWHEISFLMGYVTGPRAVACAPGVVGWPRLRGAIEAILYHELGILASGVVVLALTWGGENRIGADVFLILWMMRLSAKLNLFLGVPNTAAELLPEHLRHIESFFAKKPMNLFFPVAVTASTAVAALLIAQALADDASAFQAAGAGLLASLMTLAVIEHWFLVAPLPSTALWRWSLRARDAEVPWTTNPLTGHFGPPPTPASTARRRP